MAHDPAMHYWKKVALFWENEYGVVAAKLKRAEADNAKLREMVLAHALSPHENYSGFCLTCDEPWPCQEAA